MALLPPHYLDMVVALGITQGTLFDHKATGFLYCRPLHISSEQCHVFLVTNRHVFSDRTKMDIMVNHNETVKIYSIALKNEEGKEYWLTHEDTDYDVAAIPLTRENFHGEKINLTSYPGSDEEIVSSQSVSEGDGVFVLGFPLDAGVDPNPVVRQGIVARIRDWLGGRSKTFLIDASIFPRSSGSPVVLRPEALHYPGTKSNTRSFFIGMISASIPYDDEAYSKQTGDLRVIFRENLGLAEVVPMDVIRETVDRAHAHSPLQSE